MRLERRAGRSINKDKARYMAKLAMGIQPSLQETIAQGGEKAAAGHPEAMKQQERLANIEGLAKGLQGLGASGQPVSPAAIRSLQRAFQGGGGEIALGGTPTGGGSRLAREAVDEIPQGATPEQQVNFIFARFPDLATNPESQAQAGMALRLAGISPQKLTEMMEAERPSAWHSMFGTRREREGFTSPFWHAIWGGRESEQSYKSRVARRARHKALTGG
jgi:hypothetical protein